MKSPIDPGRTVDQMTPAEQLSHRRQCPRCQRWLRSRQRACSRACKKAIERARKRPGLTIAEVAPAAPLPAGLQQLAERLAAERMAEVAEIRALAERLGLQVLDGRKPEVPVESSEEQLARICALRGTGAYGRAVKRFAAAHYGMARDYARRWRTESIKQADLEQTAMLGLLEAVKHWDPTKARAFSTYCMFKMQAALQSFVRKKSPAVHVSHKLWVVRKRVVEAAGRGLDVPAIAAELEITEDHVRRALDANYDGAATELKDHVQAAGVAGADDLDLRRALRQAQEEAAVSNRNAAVMLGITLEEWKARYRADPALRRQAINREGKVRWPVDVLAAIAKERP